MITILTKIYELEDGGITSPSSRSGAAAVVLDDYAGHTWADIAAGRRESIGGRCSNS
jgi:hypothetical protein